ncbi:hypothetical protein [Methanobacterium sp.]|uniref:hypothetical protein n=1 Tax=Methanobacterium sp. TaxID=2164 RepID=UPI003C753473
MPRIIKFIFFLLLFGIIFEAGLLSSYTIVTSQPPDVGKVIDMQVSKLTAIWDSIGIGSKVGSAKTYNVTNVDPVANVLKSKAQLAGINIDTVAATIVSSSGGKVNVTITATGYKENETTANSSNTAFTSGQIVISPSATYNLTATATGEQKTKGIAVDVNTIKITSLKQIKS